MDMGQVGLVLSSTVPGVADVVAPPTHLPAPVPVYDHPRGQGLLLLVELDVCHLDLGIAGCVETGVEVVGS